MSLTVSGVNINQLSPQEVINNGLQIVCEKSAPQDMRVLSCLNRAFFYNDTPNTRAFYARILVNKDKEISNFQQMIRIAIGPSSKEIDPFLQQPGVKLKCEEFMTNGYELGYKCLQGYLLKELQYLAAFRLSSVGQSLQAKLILFSDALRPRLTELQIIFNESLAKFIAGHSLITETQEIKENVNEQAQHFSIIQESEIPTEDNVENRLFCVQQLAEAFINSFHENGLWGEKTICQSNPFLKEELRTRRLNELESYAKSDEYRSFKQTVSNLLKKHFATILLEIMNFEELQLLVKSRCTESGVRMTSRQIQFVQEYSKNIASLNRAFITDLQPMIKKYFFDKRSSKLLTLAEIEPVKVELLMTSDGTVQTKIELNETSTIIDLS